MRYIVTDVDDEVKAVMMSYCNVCPYLKLDTKVNSSYCSKADNKFIMHIYGTKEQQGRLSPYARLVIPNWCHLSSDIMDAKNSEMKAISSSIGAVEMSINKEIAKTISFISDINVDFNGFSMIKKPPINTVQTTTYTHNNGYAGYTPYVKKEICSCCGESKEEVSRTVNNGMCISCINANLADESNKKFVMMNNFRLKRNSTFTKDEFIDVDFFEK